MNSGSNFRILASFSCRPDYLSSCLIRMAIRIRWGLSVRKHILQKQGLDSGKHLNTGLSALPNRCGFYVRTLIWQVLVDF